MNVPEVGTATMVSLFCAVVVWFDGVEFEFEAWPGRTCSVPPTHTMDEFDSSAQT
jgi:hypothetical protein